MVCLHCGFVGCWNPLAFKTSGRHAQWHLACKSHWLAAHASRLELYCGYCGDFIDNFIEKKFERSTAKRQLISRAPFRVSHAHHYSAKTSRITSTVGTLRGWMDHCLNSTVPCLQPFEHKHTTTKNEFLEHGLRGLVNMGNTCYMSSILQVLLHNPALQALFIYEKDRSKCRSGQPCKSRICLVCEMKALFALCFESHDYASHVIVPHNMLYTIWKQSGQLASYAQQDAHELFLFFLDGLTHGGLLGIVDEIFRGTLRSDIARLCVVPSPSPRANYSV